MLLNIGNNNRHIGTVNSRDNNVKKFMVIAALGFTVLTTTGCHKAESEVVVVEGEDIQKDYTYSYEPRYSGIEYEVKWGDTLSEIVAAYESDYNKLERYVAEIERINKINGVLREGITIELVGVPESKLADYGYTADYSILGDYVYVKDAYAWLREERVWIVETDRNTEYVEKFNIDFTEFVIQYNDYIDARLNEEDEAKVQEKLDNVVKLLNELLEEFQKLTGLRFDQHHTAYPIPESKSNELGM